MIYSVVPKPLADELYPKLAEYYEGEENVSVIVDRREFDRRARSRNTVASAEAEQRVVRERRRARMPGDLPPLANPS
jgi:hypothetical protein